MQMEILINNFSGKQSYTFIGIDHVYAPKHAVHRNMNVHLACICSLVEVAYSLLSLHTFTFSWTFYYASKLAFVMSIYSSLLHCKYKFLIRFCQL